MTFRLCTKCFRMTADYVPDGKPTRCTPCVDPEAYRKKLRAMLAGEVMATNEKIRSINSKRGWPYGFGA